jgi:Na+-driven multidrug efflux pump
MVVVALAVQHLELSASMLSSVAAIPRRNTGGSNMNLAKEIIKEILAGVCFVLALLVGILLLVFKCIINPFSKENAWKTMNDCINWRE